MHIWKTQWTVIAALGQYRAWLETTRRYRERSKREYSDDISNLVQHLESTCRIRSVTAVRREHLMGFLTHCAAVGHAASTRRRSVAAIRSFFAFLVEERILGDSPARFLLPPERETRPPRVLTEAEYARLRAAATGNVRDSAIIELALQTGLRLSEISRLTIADVVLPVRSVATPPPVGYVRVVGRGTRGRTVTLNTKACGVVIAYLAERDMADSPALFLTKFGNGIGPRAIENIVTKYCKEAGIRGASVHTLRHTMAVEMLKRGAAPAIIAKALGHASTDTVAIYTDLARERMDEVLQRHMY